MSNIKRTINNRVSNTGKAGTAAAVALGCVGLLGLVLLGWVIRTTIVYFAWNLGVVNVAAALGDHVNHISYFWTSVGIAAIWSVLSGIFRRTSTAEATVKS